MLPRTLFLLLVTTLMHGQTPSSPAGGAGLALREFQGHAVIAQVMPGGPAAVAGIQAGEQLLAIDGRPVQGMPFDSLPSLIRGPVGSRVILTVVGASPMPRQVEVVRGDLNAPTAPSTPQPSPPRSPFLPAPPASAPSGVVRLTRQAIRDPAANNMEAFVFPLPAGWQAKGQIVWMHDYSVLANTRARISDPVSGTTIEYLPIQNFIWFPPMFGIQPGQNYQGKVYLSPLTDPRQFVQAFWAPQVLPHLRGLNPVKMEELPKLGAEFLRLFQGPGEAHAYRLRYEFQHEGQPWEEDVQFGLLFSGSPQLISWYVNFAVATRAPKGQLDRMAPLTSAIVGNAQATTEWLAYVRLVQRLFTQGQMQQIRDTAAFGQKLAQYNAEMQQLRQQVFEERMASQDRITGYRREILGGVETYQDSYQNYPVELPAGYKEYWVNDQGEYLLSSETGFDPNAGSTHAWRKMDRRVPGAR